MPFKDPEDKKRYNREHRIQKREEQLTISINASIPHGNVEWRDVVDYEGLYIINNYGMVKNVVKNYIHTLNDNNGYYRINLLKDEKYKTQQVHRLVALAFIPNPENKPFVDHIDNNGFNNHISNLRWATNQENQLNVKCCRNSKSGIRGVHFNTRQKKWVARYSIDKKQIHIGYFNTIEEATEARKKKVNEAYGCFIHPIEKL